jgi:hypothetical protein
VRASELPPAPPQGRRLVPADKNGHGGGHALAKPMVATAAKRGHDLPQTADFKDF